MQEKKETKKIKTVFRSYYRKYRINQLVKNLWVMIPVLPRALSAVRQKTAAILSGFLKKFVSSKSGVRRMRLIDMDLLNSTLAVHLNKQQVRMVNLPENARYHFTTVNLAGIMEKQSLLLHAMLREQQAVLKEQANEITKNERSRIKTKYDAGK